MLGSQVLAMVLFLAALLLPWWASTMVIIAAIVGMAVLPDAIFPPVVAEQFGSAADIRRAAVRFWMAAPIALFALIVVLVGMWR
jgi:hypothetical protein